MCYLIFFEWKHFLIEGGFPKFQIFSKCAITKNDDLLFYIQIFSRKYEDTSGLAGGDIYLSRHILLNEVWTLECSDGTDCSKVR